MLTHGSRLAIFAPLNNQEPDTASPTSEYSRVHTTRL